MIHLPSLYARVYESSCFIPLTYLTIYLSQKKLYFARLFDNYTDRMCFKDMIRHDRRNQTDHM